MNLRSCALIVLAAAATLVGGCSGGDIDGRVIRGPGGVATVVATGADRPDEPGIANAAVEVRAVGRAGNGPTIGTAVSGPDGRFTVSYSDRRLVRDRLQLIAHAEGYIPVQEEFFLPGTGRAVLVVMKQGRVPGAEPAPSGTVGAAGSKHGE